MRAFRYLEKLDQLVWLNRSMQLIILALSVAVLFLARHKTILHIVPATIQHEYRVGPTSASKEYVEQMAAFLTTSALTVNADNAEFSAKAFLRYLSPEARGHLDTILLGDAAYIKKNQLTQAFYPKVIDFYSPKRLRISGTLIQWIGGKVITDHDVSYNLNFEVKDYAFTITDFESVEQVRPQTVTVPAGGPATTTSTTLSPITPAR